MGKVAGMPNSQRSWLEKRDEGCVVFLLTKELLQETREKN